MIILGIDPGTSLMGYAVVQSLGHEAKLLDMGVLRFNPRHSHYQRLLPIFEQVTRVIEQWKPEQLAIEAPFCGINVQSMLKLGRAQGVAMLAAVSHGVKVIEYEPTQIKLAVTGKGSATKQQVRNMLQCQVEIDPAMLESMEMDATDALGAAMCHHYSLLSTSPIPTVKKAKGRQSAKSWSSFVANNPDSVVG